MLKTIIALGLVALATSQYHGHRLGSLCAEQSCAIRGDVFLVDAHTVQIVGLHVKPAAGASHPFVNFEIGISGKALKFVVANAEDSTVIDAWSVVQPGGEWRKAASGNLDRGMNGETVVVEIPGALANWKHFGIISETEWDFKAAVALGNIRKRQIPTEQRLPGKLTVRPRDDHLQ